MVLTLDGAPRTFPLDEDAVFAHESERWHPEQKIRRVAWAAGVGREYLALLPPTGEEFPLRCHEAGGGALLWRSLVWGMARMDVAGNGSGAVYVVIVPTERGPAVFGTDAWGDYVELFDAKSGRPLARFCSTYWFISDYVRSKPGDVGNPKALRPPLRLVFAEPVGRASARGILRGAEGREFVFLLRRPPDQAYRDVYTGRPGRHYFDTDGFADDGTFLRMLGKILQEQFRRHPKTRQLSPLRMAEFDGSPSAKSVSEAANRMRRHLESLDDWKRTER